MDHRNAGGCLSLDVCVCRPSPPLFAAEDSGGAVRLCAGLHLWLQGEPEASVHPHEPRGADAGWGLVFCLLYTFFFMV